MKRFVFIAALFFGILSFLKIDAFAVQPYSSCDDDDCNCSTTISSKHKRRYFEGGRKYRRPITFRNYWQPMEPEDHLILRYNRVEGTFVGFRWPSNHRHSWRMSHLRIFGEVGYGLENKEWRYQIGGKLSLADHFRLSVGGEFHDFTDTQDRWLIPDLENTASALFLKRDFFDYYRREGFGIFGSYYLTRDLNLKVAYKNDEYSGLPIVSNWSLFRGDRGFRINPRIHPGTMRSVEVNFVLDTRDEIWTPDVGWYITGSAEIAGGDFGGDFNFDRYILDVRRYQQIGYYENLDIRFRVGSSRGFVPAQFLFDLGGISTLPGYSFKEFTGNRVLLLNTEFRTDGDHLFGDFFILDLFHYILFVNTGLAWMSSDNSSPLTFSDFTFSDLKTDVGVALSNRAGDLRLNFAKRLDGQRRDLTVSFRVNRHF